jgi:hypothetical protein
VKREWLLTAEDGQTRGKRRLLRRLLSMPMPDAASPTDTGTQPLGAHDLPGNDIVTATTLRAIEQLARSQPGWDTRLLVGTQRALAVVSDGLQADVSIDARQVLPDSLPNLLHGTPVLATDREARRIVDLLGMSHTCTLVYGSSLIAHATLGGVIAAVPAA